MTTTNTITSTLTIKECVVRAARGHERADGMIVWSGALWIRDQPAGSFLNDGNGGCLRWDVRADQRPLFEEFEALAKREHPQNREAADWMAGHLWDQAWTNAVPK